MAFLELGGGEGGVKTPLLLAHSYIILISSSLVQTAEWQANIEYFVTIHNLWSTMQYIFFPQGQSICEQNLCVCVCVCVRELKPCLSMKYHFEYGIFIFQFVY